MSTRQQHRKPKWATLTVFLTTFAFIFFALLATGVRLQLTLQLLAVLLVQIGSGGALWALLRRGEHVSPIEILGVGFVLGSLFSIFSSQVFLSTLVSGISWALPALLITIVLIAFRKKLRFANLTAPPTREVAGYAVSIGAGLALLLPSILAIQIRGGLPTGRYSGDLVFFENLAQGISRFGPSDNILLAEEAVRYHWFVYAWQGALSNAVGAESFLVLTRVLPLILLLAVAALATAWAASMSQVNWVPTLAGLLVVVGGFVGAQQGVVINFDSPSNAYASALLLAFAIGLVPLLHMQWSSFWPTLAVLGLIAGSTVGSKASHAAVLAAGLALLSIVALRYDNRMRIRIWLLAATSGIAMFMIYWWTIFGLVPGTNQLSVGDAGIRASTFQGLDPFPTTLGAWLGTGVLILAILPRWVGLGWLVWNPVSRYAPTTVLGVGIGLAGILAVAFTSSGGTNEVWFAVAATSVIGVLSAVGIGAALEGATVRDLIPAVVFAGITTLVVFLAYALAVTSETSVLWRGPVVAWVLAGVFGGLIAWYRRIHVGSATSWLAWITLILLFVGIGARASGTSLWQFIAPRFEVSASDETPFTAEEDPTTGSNSIEDPGVFLLASPERNERYRPAASWMIANASATDIIATTSPYAEAVLSASTGLRMYVAGIPYVNGYTNQEGFTAFDRRLGNIEELVSQPSAATVEKLRDEKVRFLWVDTLTAPSQGIAELGRVVFADDAVIIVDISGSDSNSS